MRLDREVVQRPQIQAMPLASLALLVLACLMISAISSVSRGPGLRFASFDRDGSLSDSDSVRVEVLSEQDALVDGAPVPFPDLAAAVFARLADRPDAVVVLAVSPEATYETMVAAYGAIAGLPGPPPIAFPVRTRGSQG